MGRFRGKDRTTKLLNSFIPTRKSDTDIKFAASNWVKKLNYDYLNSVMKPIITKIINGAKVDQRMW
jgi:hypothetical protein